MNYFQIEGHHTVNFGEGYIARDIIQIIQNISQGVKVIDYIANFSNEVPCRTVEQEAAQYGIIALEIFERQALRR